MVKLISEANNLITLWRNFGPNSDAIDLKELFYGIVLPKSDGDKCKIVEKSFDTFEGLMAFDNELGEWRIGVNSNIGLASRKNFTLAHEIAHFIGHRHLNREFKCTFDDLNDYETEKLEKEANEFASHLLMPPDLIRDLTTDISFNHDNVTELASTFQVSKSAMAYRWIALSNKPLGFVISRDGMFTSGRANDKLYKKGTFFRFSDEVPIGAKVFDLTSPGHQISERVSHGIWNDQEDCIETSFATTQKDYIYTYLEFSE